MSYTLDENGTALTETRENVTIPADYRFSTVNDFVHSTGFSFEELQWLCLGLASSGEKLRAELEKERERSNTAVARLSLVVNSISDLINDSQGVSGLHLNGEIAPWESLLRGGHFEQWLGFYSDIVSALSAGEGGE